MLAWTTSTTPRTILRSTALHLWPRWLTLVQPSSVSGLSNVKLYRTLMDWAEEHNPKRLCFVRTHALGDIVMLVPVCRALSRLLGLESTKILVQRRFVSALGASHPGVEFAPYISGKMDWGADAHLDLNHALERDHRGGLESNKHRVELYADAMGLEMIR